MAICVCVLSCDHCTELVSVYVSHYDIIDIMSRRNRKWYDSPGLFVECERGNTSTGQMIVVVVSQPFVLGVINVHVRPTWFRMPVIAYSINVM